MLVLLHGNASVEGGFSVNNQLLTENMSRRPLWLRGWCMTPFTQLAWMSSMSTVHVNPKMIANVRQSHAANKAALLAKQQKESEAQLKAKEEKKRKAIISKLEQQKKIKLQEMRTETTEIDKKIAELKSSK
jgi:hypothetical protein